ncbi:MAG: hypothetical protein GWN71_00975, partial [Gammaproteobacteria bacterium]|nr:hypothetical protein [Gemmatimonadota bacterium]NIU72189.1 hypothetical protein [Gammaproteobacteria bacterium]
RVVVFDADGTLDALPAGWPHDLEYFALDGGFAAWEAEVLTPVEVESFRLEDIDAANRRNQIAAYFSGAKVESAGVAAPPPAMGGGEKPKKKGGC